MSKKIKTLVQKYEKDMQFENRFDELKHKLDLIPDAEIKSEVYTIKKKVMPAYAMMIVLLMLVTGIIGLQFGLNSNYIDNPETQDSVELKLMELTDTFEREAVSTVLLGDFARVHLYVGLLNNEEVIVAYLTIIQPNITASIDVENSTYTLSTANRFQLIVLNEMNVDLDFKVIFNQTIIHSENKQIDFTAYFDLLGQ